MMQIVVTDPNNPSIDEIRLILKRNECHWGSLQLLPKKVIIWGPENGDGKKIGDFELVKNGNIN